jgi:NADPH-dependent 2,4-dienoyl-CoA reductase/sulfur reductase-like enzyme
MPSASLIIAYLYYEKICLTFCLLVFTSGHLIGSAKYYDVVVYGGTPGGIASAVSAAREGASVILLEQKNHVGGLSTSGLNRDEGEHMVRWTLGGFSERFTREAADFCPLVLCDSGWKRVDGRFSVS